MGLKLNLKPSLNHSKSGNQLLRNVLNVTQRPFEEREEAARNFKSEFNETQNKDLTGLFPNIISKDQIKPYVSVAKLRGDDVNIMRRLIEKYDDDFEAMFRDIKLNYMQWAKGELKRKHQAYLAHHT